MYLKEHCSAEMLPRERRRGEDGPSGNVTRLSVCLCAVAFQQVCIRTPEIVSPYKECYRLLSISVFP